MDKEQWLKAINMTKEQLIEWLNEMYEDEKRLKDIIRNYEKYYAKEGEVYFYTDERTQKSISYIPVYTEHFEYKKYGKWS